MENVVNFEQTKDHAKEIIYFNDGEWQRKMSRRYMLL